MNKSDLIKRIASKVDDLTQDLAEKALNALIESVMEAVAGGDKVTLVGFGTFQPKERAAREGRNPTTGEALSIPATVVPAFKAGKEFKDALK